MVSKDEIYARSRRRADELQAQRDKNHAAWLAGHKDRPALYELQLASYTFTASDGYTSTAVRSNAEAADVLLKSSWLAAHDIELLARAESRELDAVVTAMLQLISTTREAMCMVGADGWLEYDDGYFDALQRIENVVSDFVVYSGEKHD